MVGHQYGPCLQHCCTALQDSYLQQARRRRDAAAGRAVLRVPERVARVEAHAPHHEPLARGVDDRAVRLGAAHGVAETLLGLAELVARAADAHPDQRVLRARQGRLRPQQNAESADPEKRSAGAPSRLACHAGWLMESHGAALLVGRG